MKSFGETDIGRKRKVNQDYIFFSDENIGNLPNLYIVADGMGGHQSGDKASSFVVENFVECMRRNQSVNPITSIKEVLSVVNKKLIEETKKDKDYEGMGTTFVCAVVLDNHMYVANIGDSRLYLIRDDIKQITLDHSWVEELIRRGEIDRNNVRNHPKKNIITRAIGAGINMDPIPDFFEIDLKHNDYILLCSDGLSNMLENEEIFEIVNNQKSLEERVEELIDRANYYGGKDNIAVVLVKND